MEKYKRIKKEKRISRLKFMTFLIILVTMFYGVFFVNDTIKDFDVIEKDNLIRLDIENWEIELLGKTYYIEIDRIKNVLN